ncbi:MAG: YfhO family protein, partial [Alistipes sp.]|nr:YfhO family protein [Alistipes sp.]
LRYLSHDNFVQSSSNRVYPTLADKKILQDKELGYRVFNLTVSPFNDATTSYFHRSIGGYHGAKLSRYQDIIEHYLSNFDEGVLDMLNTRYLIISKDSVVRRESANGAAWFVDHIITTTSPREEILALSEIDTRHTAIISEQDLDLATAIEGGFTQDSLADAHIELVEYRPNHLKYNYYSSEPRVAVFSEIFYNKGWRAYVDGVESPYFRADYILRAMQLPEGEHTVEWRFRAPKWSVVEGITLLCSIMILVGVLLALTLPAYRKFKQKATKEDER